jgi:hypothetical protein
VHERELTRLIKFEAGNAFAVGEAGGFGELAELAAIDKRLEDVLQSAGPERPRTTKAGPFRSRLRFEPYSKLTLFSFTRARTCEVRKPSQS